MVMNMHTQKADRDREESKGTMEMLREGPLPAKVISGNPATGWRVEERMARYHVPAVSAAVVR